MPGSWGQPWNLTSGRNNKPKPTGDIDIAVVIDDDPCACLRIPSMRISILVLPIRRLVGGRSIHRLSRSVSHTAIARAFHDTRRGCPIALRHVRRRHRACSVRCRSDCLSIFCRILWIVGLGKSSHVRPPDRHRVRHPHDRIVDVERNVHLVNLILTTVQLRGFETVAPYRTAECRRYKSSCMQTSRVYVQLPQEYDNSDDFIMIWSFGNVGLLVRRISAFGGLSFDRFVNRNNPSPVLVGRCGVVGSTLAFGSIGHGFRNRAPLIFTSWCISLQQAEITGEVLTGRFSSSTTVVHSASYPPGRANRIAAYQW